jgi:hypothetical protein
MSNTEIPLLDELKDLKENLELEAQSKFKQSSKQELHEFIKRRNILSIQITQIENQRLSGIGDKLKEIEPQLKESMDNLNFQIAEANNTVEILNRLNIITSLLSNVTKLIL